MKLIFAEADDRLLGAHIVGSEATEMIAELASCFLAAELGIHFNVPAVFFLSDDDEAKAQK